MRRRKRGSVYIVASKRLGTLYTGVSSNLRKRVWQHRNHVYNGFSSWYRVHRLVYFEHHARIDQAIRREKQLKHWLRAWKLDLIEQFNPGWVDLYEHPPWPSALDTQAFDG